MDIQDKSTGLSKMPLNIVHDENIEQDDISHEYYEIKSGVENTSFLILYTKIRILNRCQNIKNRIHIQHACC